MSKQSAYCACDGHPWIGPDGNCSVCRKPQTWTHAEMRTVDEIVAELAAKDLRVLADYAVTSAFDVPPWMVGTCSRPRFARARWALRRVWPRLDLGSPSLRPLWASVRPLGGHLTALDRVQGVQEHTGA
jgi:hypothetical protein